jgi:hypothetical protein
MAATTAAVRPLRPQPTSVFDLPFRLFSDYNAHRRTDHRQEHHKDGMQRFARSFSKVMAVFGPLFALVEFLLRISRTVPLIPIGHQTLGRANRRRLPGFLYH